MKSKKLWIGNNINIYKYKSILFMKFYEYLLLENMSLDDAMTLFGLDSIDSLQDINKKYKELAMKYHPDIGGSEEMMKQINQAKEVLSKNVGKHTSKSSSPYHIDKEERNRRYKIVDDFINDLFDKFNFEIYKKYLENIFNVSFDYKVNRGSGGSHYNSFLEVEFYDKERDKVVKLHLSCFNTDVYVALFNETGLTDKSKTFNIYMSSTLYIDGKKQVLVKERYQKNNDVSMFTDPSILLPEAKLKKIASGKVRKNSKLAKRDFEAMFIQKFGGKELYKNGSYSTYLIPLNDSIVLITRNVLSIGYGPKNRFSYYQLEGVHNPPSKKFSYYDELYNARYILKTYKNYMLPETKESFDAMVELFNYLKRTGNKEEFMKRFSEKAKELAPSEE